MLKPILRRLRTLSWRRDYRRLETLRGLGAGRRAFLVGSGPSLGAMDLAPLSGEFVCVVNMGLRAVGTVLPHADMHVVTDTNRYRRFADEIEAIALAHPMPYRFVSRRVKRLWRAREPRANEPFYLVPHVSKLADGVVPPVEEGVVRASSVLLTGAVLLEFMGFSPIYVIGCDLDYDGPGKYFYEMDRLDVVHENDPKVIGRRPGVANVSDQFAVLEAAFAARGHHILNAGIGGRLESLPRVAFQDLFTRAPD